MALSTRGMTAIPTTAGLEGLIHHSDGSSRRTALLYADELAMLAHSPASLVPATSSIMPSQTQAVLSTATSTGTSRRVRFRL
jgi:hypothetical protein